MGHLVNSKTHTEVKASSSLILEGANLSGFLSHYRSSHRWCSVKISVLKSLTKFTRRYLRWTLSFIKKETPAQAFTKIETPTQVFSCEFCKIFKDIFFKRTPAGDCV